MAWFFLTFPFGFKKSTTSPHSGEVDSMTPNDVIKLAKDNGVQFVDLLYGDMFGILQHFTFPVSRLDAAMFADGMAFDGSSIRGWKTIDKSDMIMKPDPESAFLDPFRIIPTLNLFCDI